MQPNPTVPNLTTVRELVPFSFKGIDLKESCWINGTPHYTRRAIGAFLGYAGHQAQRAIDKIIERNPYIREWAVTVRLTVTDGKTYNIEVYSPIGLQLITFESRQQKARDFKVAVAHLVWACMNGQLCPPVDPSYAAQLRALDLLPRGQRGVAVRVLAQAKDCCTHTIRNHRALVREGRDPSRKRHWTSMDHWDRRFPRQKALVLAAVAEGWTRVQIWSEALQCPVKPSLYMVGALARRLTHAHMLTPLMNP